MTDDTPIALTQLNILADAQALAHFLACCHSQRWAKAMLDARPFDTLAALLASADHHWQQCGEEDVLEAFRGHAKIGDLEALRGKFAAQATREQGQIRDSDDAVLLALRDLNQTYETKFGFIFILCASGKSAQAMLTALQQRLGNTRAEEFANGAHEQGKITALRLQQRVTDL